MCRQLEYILLVISSVIAFTVACDLLPVKVGSEDYQNVVCTGNKMDNLWLPPLVKDLTCVRCTAMSLAGDQYGGMFEKIQTLRLEHLSLTTTSEKQPFKGLNDRGLTNLTIVKSRRGDLHSLGAGFLGGLRNMQLIDLQHNHIHKLAAYTFQDTTKIASIILDHNPLSELAANSFSGLSHVGVLSIRYATGLVGLRPHVFHGLSGVKKLVIKHCPLTHIDIGAFRGLENVQHIIISYTHLQTLDQIFGEISGTIASIDLSHNELHTLSNTLIESHLELQLLSFEHNKLKRLSKSVLATEARTEAPLEVRLQHNPLHCDCQLLWLVKMFKARAQMLNTTWESLATGVRCSSPMLAEPYLVDNKLYYSKCEAAHKPTVGYVRVYASTDEPKKDPVIVKDNAAASLAPGLLVLLSASRYVL